MTIETLTYQIIVSSSLLQGRLAPLKALVESNPILPVLSNFLFELESDQLKVTSSNNQNFLSTNVPVDTKSEGFSTCVPAKLLMDLLDKLPEQPITLSFKNDLTELIVTTHSGTFNIPLEDCVDWPHSSEATPGIQFELPVDHLAHALAHTTFATSGDELRPFLTCVYIESDLGLRFIASDGHRVVRVERPNAGIDDLKALLPRKAAAILTKLLPESDGNVSIEVTPTTIVFILPIYELVTVQAEGEYPTTEQLFRLNPYVLDCEKAMISAALKTTLLFADKETSRVRFDLEDPETLIITAENEVWRRRAREVVEDSNYDGDKLAIGFNGKLLLELLEHVDGNRVELSFMAPNKGVVIRESSVTSDEVTVTSVMMPMMLMDS